MSLKLYTIRSKGGRSSWSLVAAINGVDALKFATEADPKLKDETVDIRVIGTAGEEVDRGHFATFCDREDDG